MSSSNTVSMNAFTPSSFSIIGLVFFVLNSFLGIARQWSREKFAILTLKPRSHVRILIHRTFGNDRFKTRCSACIQKLVPRIHKKSKAVKWD